MITIPYIGILNAILDLIPTHFNLHVLGLQQILKCEELT